VEGVGSVDVEVAARRGGERVDLRHGDEVDRRAARCGPVPASSPTPATGSRLVPPTDTDYGMREFAVVDPSGNLVRVG